MQRRQAAGLLSHQSPYLLISQITSAHWVKSAGYKPHGSQLLIKITVALSSYEEDADWRLQLVKQCLSQRLFVFSVTVAVGWLHAEEKLVSFLVLQCFNFILSSNSPPTLIIFELFHQSVLTTAHYTFNNGLFPSISQISCCLIYEELKVQFLTSWMFFKNSHWDSLLSQGFANALSILYICSYTNRLACRALL